MYRHCRVCCEEQWFDQVHGKTFVCDECMNQDEVSDKEYASYLERVRWLDEEPETD